MLMRRLLDGERFSHEGRFYTIHDALCEPRPVQPRLPILVGGSGPKKTLRTTARYADAWNTSGTLDEVREKVGDPRRALRRRRAATRRDRADRQLPDRHPRHREEARRASRAPRSTGPTPATVTRSSSVAGRASPTEIAAVPRRARLPTSSSGCPRPYDRETIERIGEVRALLGDA
jgi:alkanesulfonate monooxygenase SsuD/methylene tetrahydromethanopterin reductase-like flavin-dependent oxidoreductase (luciferase family)